MWRVEVACDPGEEELAIARFMDYEVAAVDQGEAVVRAWFAMRAEADRCAVDLGGLVSEEAVQNWNQAWQSEWSALAVGERIWLAPPWDATPAPDGRIRLEMHPGTLFGNGDHPTTLLCLEALEQVVTPGCTLVDVGCGSGLLQQAAIALGAGRAIGCDLDFEAARTAPDAYQGSVDAIPDAAADVLVANIQLGVLEVLLPDFRRVLKPGGALVLSGILEDQVPAIEGSWDVRLRDGWACLVSAGSGERQ
jgi:ribosomal protein L11 methyltransferase